MITATLALVAFAVVMFVAGAALAGAIDSGNRYAHDRDRLGVWIAALAILLILAGATTLTVLLARWVS